MPLIETMTNYIVVEQETDNNYDILHVNNNKGKLVDMAAAVTATKQEQSHPQPNYFLQRHQQLVERCVLVTRQHDGYGLTISGNHPVFVNTVKPNGAALRAGVRKGDRVVKVNGMPVTSSNYQEVLRMISGGHNVALTLLSQSQQFAQFPFLSPHLSSSVCDDVEGDGKITYQRFLNENIHRNSHSFAENNCSLFSQHHKKRESIQSNQTEPIFSSCDLHTQQYEWKHQRVNELFQILKKERKLLESLRKSETSSLPKSIKFKTTLQRINELQQELINIDPNLIVDNGSTFWSTKTVAPPSASPSVIGSSVLSVNNNNNTIEPVKSWVESGRMHYVQTGHDLISTEENSGNEAEMEEGTGPFSNLVDLKTRSAHLAVFLSYLLNNSNSSSLLFYLITDSYQSSSNTKELRRFAYEIFSTFVIPYSPLQLPNIKQPLIQQIDKILHSVASSNGSVSTAGVTTTQDVKQLKNLFIQARTRAVGVINQQLMQFRRKRALGGQGESLGIDINQLDHIARADYTASIKISEQILFRHLEALIAQAGGNTTASAFDPDFFDARTLALISSIATVIKIVIGLKTSYSPWEKLLEKCPTFMTSSKSTMLSKMKPKRTIQIKDHQFLLNTVCLTTSCYQCREVIWGVNPQAYFCQYCDVIVHKQCTAQLNDHCYPFASQQKASKNNALTSANLNMGKGNISSSRRDDNKGKNQTSGVNVSSVSLDAASVLQCTSSAIAPGSELSGAGVYKYYHQSRISAPSESLSSISATRHISSTFGVRQKQNATASLTPPLNRSHASTATIVGSTLSVGGAGGTGSQSCLNYENEDLNENGEKSNKPSPLPPIAYAVHMATATVSSSPASSSKSMLPLPVFSQKFEQIAAPDPSANELSQSLISPKLIVLKGQRESAPVVEGQQSTLSAAAVVIDNFKSMSSDSGIGGEFMPDSHVILRAQSMKVEPSTHGSLIRRNGRGVNSLGAADSPAMPTFSGGAVLSPLVTSDTTYQEQTKSITKPVATANELLPATTLNRHSAFTLAPSKSEITLMASNSGSDLNSKSILDITSSMIVTPQFVSVLPSLNRGVNDSSAISTSSLTRDTENEIDEARRQLIECVEKTVIAESDSDLEVETEVPPLESVLTWEILRNLKPKEKKRQEVINELFHTERTHVRNLKILFKIFYRPLIMQRIAPTELICLLFGNLNELLAVHQDMYTKMRQAILAWRQQFALGQYINDANSEAGGSVTSANTTAASMVAPYGNIGELIETIFDGNTGKCLMRETAIFCQNQQHALDTLRQKYNRNKDDPFLAFLADAESHPLCRKLQLKDMIPVEMQRLVKYPLLLETIAKYTQDPSEELTRLLHGVNCAKKILSAVNTAKRNAENRRRLDEIQKCVDFSGSDKTSTFFQKFDFRNHRLIYEGALQWRQARNKTIDLHVVLLEHLLVFLTKTGANDASPANQKWQLKVHEAGCIPIMKLSFVEVEEKPGDKRTFNLLYKCDLRMFELVSATATEKKTWHRLIENQIVVSRQKHPSTDNIFNFSTPTHLIDGDVNRFNDNKMTIGAKSTVIEPEPSARATTRIEQVQVLMHPNLVTANEIVVEQPRIFEHAQQLQTPAEQLYKHDKAIITALVDKHNILSEMLKDQNKGNVEELEKISDLMTGLDVMELKQRSSRELAMSAIVHGNRLLDCINQGMSLTLSVNQEKDSALKTLEQNLPSVPCYKLTAVAAPLMNHLKALMQVIQDQDQQINQLKQQDSPNANLNTVNNSTNANNKAQIVFVDTRRNTNSNIIAKLIDVDNSNPPQPPLSAPPPLD